MKNRSMSHVCGVLILFAGILMRSTDVYAREASADWWAAQRDVTAVLMDSGTNLATLATQVCQSAPTNGQAAMFEVCVLARTGMTKELIQALHELKRVSPELDNYQVSSIYYDACDRLKAWNVAEAVAVIFADNICELSLGNRLLKHFLNSGWPVERVDEWLASKPKGGKNFWLKERLRFNMQHGRGEALEKKLADHVRADPQDVAGALDFLDAIIYARTDRQKMPDLAWLADTIKPEMATDASEMASRLVTLNQWRYAVVFYRQAVAIPLTDREVQRLAMMCQIFMPENTVRASFAAHIREGLAGCFLKLEQADEAQEWMLAASDIREKNHLGRNALFAGQVQGESGQRVIEGQIKAEEETSKNEPQYWLVRAQYYRGRKESAEEESALKQGLALTYPQPEPTRMAKGYTDWRSRLLSDYAGFLAREKRAEEAVTLLRKEIAESPAMSASSKRAANMLTFDFPKQLRVDDAVLWAWLENCPKWEYTEERLLWRMLENAKPNELDGHFTRAEKLTFGKDASSAHTLGWIENRMGFPKRSIPLLEYAAGKAQDKELKGRALFSLFESYLDTADWRHAESVFPEAARRLTSKELPEWYSKIAVLAAKAGDKGEAMRIWSRVANLDLSVTEALEELKNAGLRDELIDFYREVQKAIPLSDIPAQVLETLKKTGCQQDECMRRHVAAPDPHRWQEEDDDEFRSGHCCGADTWCSRMCNTGSAAGEGLARTDWARMWARARRKSEAGSHGGAP